MSMDLPTIDVGSPPESDDPNETMEWWSDALNALRDHMDDWVHAMIGSHCHMEPRYEIREVEKSAEHPYMNDDGSVGMDVHTWTEEEKVMVGEKKVCNGHYIDVEVTSESEKMAVVALANSAGLNVSERHGGSRYTHRLESA